MPPRKAKKRPSTPVVISDYSADGEYVDSEASQIEEDSDDSKTSEEISPADMKILTPLKPRTRGRVAEPPVTPSPKKTPARGTKRPVNDVTGTITSSQQESPTKKKRTNEGTSTKATLSPPKSANKLTAKTPRVPTPRKTKNNKEMGTDEAIISDTDDNNSDINEADNDASINERTKDKKGKSKSIVQIDHDPVYLEDLDVKPKLPNLKTCGVFNKESVDELLKYTYSKLPKLPGGKRLIGWMSASQQNSEEGFAFFSSVKDIYPKADISYLRDLLCFQADKTMNAVNLCRADPSLFCLKVMVGMGSSSYICYRGAMAPTRCLIMGLMHEDKTQAPYQLSTGKWMKSISLIPFALEADRMIAAIAVIYETNDFHGQVVNGNIISFATRQGLLDSSRASSSSPKANRGRFAKPTSAVGSSSSQTIVMGVRGPEDDIPILDAREKKIKLPDNIKNIVESFPRFSGSVPRDSLVLACFTASKYLKNNDIYASFNIQWAAVLCGEDA